MKFSISLFRPNAAECFERSFVVRFSPRTRLSVMKSRNVPLDRTSYDSTGVRHSPRTYGQMIAFGETALSNVADVFADGLQTSAADGGNGDVRDRGRGHDGVT